jgi:5'-3' exonuclease
MTQTSVFLIALLYDFGKFILRWRGVLDTTLCDWVCEWFATGLSFSPGTPVSSTNKTDLHILTEILLKVALNTKTLTLTLQKYIDIYTPTVIIIQKW